MLLYLHIPFCDSKCFYCSFNSYTTLHHTQKAYMRSILKQLDFELKRFEVNRYDIETLFIGGGTPSCVEASLYKPFFEKIEPFLKKDAEITIEANPNSASLKWLEKMRSLGVNRISFGVQSFNEKKLKFLGRNHTPQAAQTAIKNAHKSGFLNISLDLLYGTNLDTRDLLNEDINTSFDLPINHISAYSLTIEENTPFFKMPSAKKDDENIAFWFSENLKKRGFRQYEISNFGTYESKHNLGYWRYKDYIGIGGGAVGFMKKRRFYPHKSVEKYITDPTFTTIENLNEEDIVTEKTLLGLRSVVGVDISIFSKSQMRKIFDLITEKKIYMQKDRIYNRDFFISDEIALYILS